VTRLVSYFRIQPGRAADGLAGMLKGVVEVDETYVGGKPRKGTGPHKRGRGTKKTPVMVLVERDGAARTMPLENITGDTLKGQVEVHVAKKSVIMTDELAGYMGLADGPDGFAAHETSSMGPVNTRGRARTGYESTRIRQRTASPS
jgi:hypothetical protein